MKRVYAGAIVSAVVSALWAGAVLWFKYRFLAFACYGAMIVAFPFASLAHELGHMLFGAVSGLKAVPEFSLFGPSSCKLVPRTDKNLRMRVLFTAFGGISVNFVFCIAGALGLLVTEAAFLSVFLPASSYLFWLNAGQAEFSDGKTDGLVISEFYNNDDSAKVAVAVLTAQAKMLKGARVEELDRNLLFGQPVIREDDPAFIALTQLKRDYCSAVGDAEGEKALNERIEQLKEYL